MADKKDSKEVELEPVGPGAVIEPEDQTARDVAGEDIRDDRDDDRDDKDDRDTREEGREEERAGHADDDEEDGSGDDRERIRARRRAERRQKKDDNRRNQRELNFLRQRNEQLEKRQSEFDARIVNSEVVTIDTRIQTLEADIRKADDVYAEAITKGDGATAAEAQKIRDTLRDGVQKLAHTKQGIVNNARERLSPGNRPDPEIQRRAQDWMENNRWFTRNGDDEDSVIASAIEAKLFRERGPQGARSDDYWREYNSRLKKRLPHLFERNSRRDREDDRDDDDERYDATDDRDVEDTNDRDRRNGNGRNRDSDRDGDRPARRNGGPRFTSGGRERPLKKNEVYVSEERRKAMEEAGVWEDPVLRGRYLKSYQNYDAAARRNRN